MKRITNNRKQLVNSIFKSSNWLIIILVVSSCHKSGSGGKAMLMITPQHHGINIINHVGYPDTVFVKYNSNELPGTKPSDYDAYFVGAPRSSEIDCDNLKWGKYYIYVVGFDSAGPYRVTGGIPLNVKYSQRKSMVMVTVPVTE